MAWSIEAARASGVCDRIIVTTEDDEIAEVARQWGAELPFLRPPELARDDVPNQAAIDHALGWLAEHENYVPEAVLILQPTSPLRSGDDIRAAVELLATSGASSVVSVSPARTPPHLLRQMEDKGRLSAWRAAEPPPVSALQRAALFQLNGAIYIDRHPCVPAGEAPVGYIMPPERSLDIDSPWDLRLAEATLKTSLS